MMLYQRIRLIFIAFLTVSVLTGLPGAAAPVKKVPRQIKPLPQIELPYDVCNKGCVNLMVKQSCKREPRFNFADVEVCTREDMRIGTKFKCDTYRDFCFPFKCDNVGKACLHWCYSDADCQPPNRCIKELIKHGVKKGQYGNGRCRVKWSCSPSVQGKKPDILSNGIETVNCGYYICMPGPTPRCLRSCNNIHDCAGDYVCHFDGHCGPFDPNHR